MALATGLALAGCAQPEAVADPEPDPTPIATPTPTPTAEPDPLETVVEIVLRPEQLDLHDETGATVAELSYDLPTGELVETLSTVFDVAPEYRLQPAQVEGHRPISTSGMDSGSPTTSWVMSRAATPRRRGPGTRTTGRTRGA
ncbi:hypothetical protein [Agromyces rhizosphaerae]|uniref:hypothetical protein n=1 Tax=Agromyces rhizosphaerae TaxID=88374 RepID=UPI002490ED58|nr:hypothetical protein [Agromyces rhizosphaerae]